MPPRFVLIPAVQVEERSYRSGIKHHSETHRGGFDIYDNQEKVRLAHGFQDRTVAESACANINIDAGNPNLTNIYKPFKS